LKRLWGTRRRCFGALVCLLLWGLCRPASATPRLVSLEVKDNLERSVVRSLPREGPAVAAQVARLLRWRGDVSRNLHRGDTLRLLYTPPGPGDTEPNLLALHYRGLQVQLHAYQYTDASGIARYYTESGARVEPQMLNPPVPRYVQITETLQRGRGRRRHRGIDLKAPSGTPIVLPWGATVRRVNWARRRNGQCIEVMYDDGRLGRFLHLSRVEAAVQRGAHLAAQTSLGQVGNTGHSNAPHLHYEVWLGGRPVEPLDAHGRSTAALTGAELQGFAVQRAAYDRALLGPTARTPWPQKLSAQQSEVRLGFSPPWRRTAAP
jgi:murein DD-endopeptidase